MARSKGRAKAIPHPEPEKVIIYANILQQTEATEEHDGAILINCGSEEGIWLPISKIEFDGERGDTGVEITLPDWLAEEKGLADGMGRPGTTASPTSEDTVTFYGSCHDDAEDQGKGHIVFKIKRNDASIDFHVPFDQIINLCVETQEEASITVSRVYAIEAGMTEDQGEALSGDDSPTTFTFKANVEHVYEEKYVLLVTNQRGGTASLEFDKDTVSYDGQDSADLQEGYTGLEFTVPYALAVEKHLPEFLGVTAVPAVEADVNDGDEDGTPKTRPYRHKLRSATITDYIELSDAERIAYGKDLVKHLEAEADYKSTASDYSARARGEKKRADKIVELLSAGREERSITCDVVADYNRDHLVYVESEWPHREIRRERLTEKDRQLTLFDTGMPQTAQLSEPEDEGAPEADTQGDESGEDEPAAVEADVEPESDQERSCGTCAHIHATPGGNEPDPCFDCDDTERPNWTATGSEMTIPVAGQPAAQPVMQ